VSTTPAAKEPSLVDLQVQLGVAREEFMASVTDLKSQFSPGALTARAGRAVLGWFHNDQGGIRPERVAIAGAVVAGIVVIKVIGARRR
jgi:hypothetical protein